MLPASYARRKSQSRGRSRSCWPAPGAKAAQAWEEIGCPLWVAQSLGRSPDLDAAREAVDILDRIGAPAVREAVLRTRHANGSARSPRPTPGERTHDAQLTPASSRCWHLVAGGLSNADVSRQLYISEKTVGHHMSSILRKLKQPTRARAVALAAVKAWCPRHIGRIREQRRQYGSRSDVPGCPHKVDWWYGQSVRTNELKEWSDGSVHGHA